MYNENKREIMHIYLQIHTSDTYDLCINKMFYISLITIYNCIIVSQCMIVRTCFDARKLTYLTVYVTYGGG